MPKIIREQVRTFNLYFGMRQWMEAGTKTRTQDQSLRSFFVGIKFVINVPNNELEIGPRAYILVLIQF